MSPGQFLIYDSSKKIITFNPMLSSEGTTHKVSILVSDTYESVTYSFTLTVTFPPPPDFATVLLSQTVKMGEKAVYTLPPIINPATNDDTNVTVIYTTKQSFVTFNDTSYAKSLNINPSLTDFTKMGTFTVGITLKAVQG